MTKAIFDALAVIPIPVTQKELTMPTAGLLSNKPIRCISTTTYTVPELGYEVITTHYDDGGIEVTTRGLLHGPWLPTVYQVQTYDGSHYCLPFINEEKWRNTDSYGECHPWLERRGANYTLSLAVNRVGWVTNKESLRPQLQRALRTWHTKLTADLADAEEALVEALFKPL